MSARVAELCGRHPVLVLAGWLLLVLVALPFATRVGEVLTAQPTAAADSVPTRVREILAREFSQQDDFSVVLVSRGVEARVAEPAFEHEYARVVGALEGIPGVTGIRDYRRGGGLQLIADDGSYAVSLLGIEAETSLEAKEISAAIRAVLERSEGIDFAVAGGPASLQELEEISARDAHRAELYGLPLSLLVLIIAFGNLVASGLPLLVAVVSITVSFAALFALGQLMEFAVFTQSIVTMLGLATGIDYALLMVNRFREELRGGASPHEAAVTTARTAGRSATFSGATVIIALAALLVPPLPFIRSIGVGAMVVLTVSVLVSTTALPALLALLGHRVNALPLAKRQRLGLRSRTFWRAQAERIMRRPGVWATAGAGALLLLSLPALRMQVADPGAYGLSRDTDSRQVVEALAGLGLEGMLEPFQVLVDFGDTGFYHPRSQRRLTALTRQLQDLPEVGLAYSAMAVDTLPRLLLYQYYATPETALGSELRELVVDTVSEDGRYALVSVFPAGNLVPAESAGLRRAIDEAVAGVGVDALVGGPSVFESEWTRRLYQSFPLAIGLVAATILVVLGFAFRSVLIPIKSILLNALTVASAYGVITLVFQDGFLAGLLGVDRGLGYVDSSAPLFIFAIVFGLSMDYEVFLVSRIVEAHLRGLSDRAAVIDALGATGGVISSAAAVMVVVFSSFLFSEVVLIKTLGLGLTVAVLLDATLVRLALVPAVIALLGRWNWWLPQPMAALAERVDLGHD